MIVVVVVVVVVVDTLFRFINTLVQFCGEHADSVSCRFCVLDLLLSNSFPNIRMRRRVCKWQAARLNFQFDKVKEETRYFDMF